MEKENMLYFNRKWDMGVDYVCLVRKEDTEKITCEQRSVGR